SYTNPPLAAEAPSPKKALMGENRPGSNCSGEQLDPNTQFYYLRARWMKPSTGRFLSVDSADGDVLQPLSIHRYMYANAAPTMNVDPSGHAAVSLYDVTIATAVTSILAILARPVIKKFRTPPRAPETRNSMDYCGTKNFDVPEYLFKWFHMFDFGDYLGPCHKHDVCYGDCCTSKFDCDYMFLVTMYERCAFSDAYPICILVANIYYAGVNLPPADKAFANARSSCP
ncbi:MAG: hypothetical protein GF331_09880, partial [Chitinivibrionales bacterium]|nr:hypothetical protein [Chitinivibrionales bacterium]